MQIPSIPFRVIRLRGAANSILLLAAVSLFPGCEKQPEMSLSKDQMAFVRGDYAIDVIMRIYAPDVERMNSWQAPKAEKVAAPQTGAAAEPDQAGVAPAVAFDPKQIDNLVRRTYELF